MLFVVSILIILLSLVLWIKHYTQYQGDSIKFHLNKGDSVLLVVSHPDDECLFFSPTILYLKKKEIRVSVLCLSTGNFYGLAKQRVKELTYSCKNLGVATRDIFCLDDFKDNPKELWCVESVSEAIKTHIIKVDAKVVLTFDGSGVSGHLNHIATYEGVRYLLWNNLIQKPIKIYTLNTVFLFRKYIQVLDIFFSCIYSNWQRSSVFVVASPFDYIIAYRSMLCHRSQLVWFRHLMIIFSRYMFMNTWNELQDAPEVN